VNAPSRNQEIWMKRTIIVVVALLVGLAVPVVAQAAPSMSIDRVVSPTGPAVEDNLTQQTTWHVGLSGVSAWNSSECSSTATYANSESYPYGGDTVDGDDADPNGPWNSWSFTATTPGDWMAAPTPDDPWAESFNLVPLSSISASCTLYRKVYLGRRYYHRAVSLYRSGSGAVRRNGCAIYSYSGSNLTIDCRRSRSTGSATWSFKLKSTDWANRSRVYFNPGQSTMGSHPVTMARIGNKEYVTEHVSPGTMITVSSVELNVSRSYSRKVYRHDSKTLSASWSS
jgi:hypothetical protein